MLDVHQPGGLVAGDGYQLGGLVNVADANG